MFKNIREFFYDGPVYITDKSGKFSSTKISSYSWKGKTKASSAKEAINNLKHQYRKEYGMNIHVPLLMRSYSLRENTKEGD